MKAFALTSADKPATLVDLPDPGVPAGGVRIRVRAASVNGIDVYVANGYLVPMMEHRFPTVVGRDFAGVVDAVGEGRIDLAAGDEVFGFVPTTPPLETGTFAELVAGGPELVVARRPAGVSAEAAASIPLAGATALDSIDAAAIGAGDTVLVVGATGGVGSFVVQLAALRGATVIATAKAGDEDAFVRGLGAAETVDYTSGDVAQAIAGRFPDGIDALVDLVSRGEAFTGMAGLVRDGGRIATTLSAAAVDDLATRGIRATNVMGLPTPAKLELLAGLVAAGTVRVEVQRTFALADAPAALAAFGSGTLGKLVLTIGEAPAR
jgi:NADPH:quinone reductase